MAITNELVTEYSVTLKDQTLTVLNNLQTSFEKINNLATDFGKILTGGQDFTSFFKQFVSGATDIRNMAKATGISTKAIQEWSYAAKASGVSADSVLNDMKSLKAQYAIGEKDLLRLSKTFSKSSAFYSQQLGSYLGMSQDMITLLRQGPEEVKKLLDEAHKMNAVLSEEQISKAATAQEEFNKTMAAFTGTLQQVMAENVLPKITEFFEKLNKYLGEHPDQMLEKVGAAFKIIVGIKFVSWITKVGSELGKFSKIMIDTKTQSLAMSNTFSSAVNEMAKKEKTIGAIGKTLQGLGSGISKLTGFLKTMSMAWAAFEIGQGIGKLLGLDDENNALGKWFSEAGEDAGDLIYELFKGKNKGISDLPEEELNKIRASVGLKVPATTDNIANKGPAPQVLPNVQNNSSTSIDNSSNDTTSTVINNYNIWNVSGGNGMNLLGYPNNT
jgi:hypothetical protein